MSLWRLLDLFLFSREEEFFYHREKIHLHSRAFLHREVHTMKAYFRYSGICLFGIDSLNLTPSRNTLLEEMVFC